MATLIRNRQIVHDNWQWLEAVPDEPLPDAGDIIVPLAYWQRERASLLERSGRTGVWLDGAEHPESLAEDVERLPLIAIRFPKFTDGRGYSAARLLRERYGYQDELRAVGDVQRDQLLFLFRCGFDAFALKAGQNAEAALAAFTEFSEAYQAAIDRPFPLFRRRADTSEVAERTWSR